jgi:hypothetical protein
MTSTPVPDPKPLVCTNGHGLVSQTAFCPTCGAPAAGPVPKPHAKYPVASRYFVVLTATALVLIALGVVLVVSRSDDPGSNKPPSRDAIGPQVTSTAQSPAQQCQSEMSVVLTKLVGDIAAGYGNFDGPGATEVAAEHGMASAFFQAAAQVTSEAYSAYLERGTQGAADAIPGIAARACSTLVKSEAPVATDEPLNGLPQPSQGAQVPGCTAGVSACTFQNGIDGNALLYDIAQQFSASAGVTCDLGDIIFSSVAVGDTFYCSTDSSGYPTVAVLVTDSEPFYSISAAPNSGD